jgi:hypothetical protein
MAFPPGQAFRSYYTGISHGPVSAAILNASSSITLLFSNLGEY